MSAEPYYVDPTVTIHHGDCLDVLRELPDASVDAVVTDPPYGLEFMGKEWDAPWKDNGRWTEGEHGQQGRIDGQGGMDTWGARPKFVAGRPFQQWCEQWAAECLRVLKPGGHMLAFGGTRTWHRLACAVEDAGFEVRDSIAWLYGSGFPKSLDVSKAIDKAAGAEREVVGFDEAHAARNPNGRTGTLRLDGFTTREELEAAAARDEQTPYGRSARATLARLNARAETVGDITAPATPDAERWQGWGTALKPAHEPIVVARKPLAGTVAQSVLAHGTGALNIDGCRIEHASADDLATSQAKNPGRDDTVTSGVYGAGRPQQSVNTAGRWPPNVVLDESQAAALDAQSGEQRDGTVVSERRFAGWEKSGELEPSGQTYGGSGGASRFFYIAKADSSERIRLDGTAHPTVKPLALMRWLVRLVTPPGGTVLEPFAGSGTTVEACILEGFRCIAVEREADYLPLIRQRIHRRRDPVAAVKATGDDGGLFDLLGEEPA